jgi:hypothetical protein
MVTRFNIIGFDPAYRQSKWHPTKTCPFHYCILIPKKEQNGVYDGMLQCPQCGTPFSERDAAVPEQIHSMFGPSSGRSRIIQGKNRKKIYFSDDGEEINDEVLLQDVARGAHVLKYHEEKSGEDKPHIVRKDRK